MTECTCELLDQITRVLKKLPNNISVSGHTDTNPLNRDDYSNWELSSDRANTSREELMPSGIAPSRIVQVISKAVQEPMIEEDPFLPQNHHVSMALKWPSAVLPPGLLE